MNKYKLQQLWQIGVISLLYPLLGWPPWNSPGRKVLPSSHLELSFSNLEKVNKNGKKQKHQAPWDGYGEVKAMEGRQGHTFSWRIHDSRWFWWVKCLFRWAIMWTLVSMQKMDIFTRRKYSIWTLLLDETTCKIKINCNFVLLGTL